MSESPNGQSSLLKYVLAGAGFAAICLCIVLVGAGGYYFTQGNGSLPALLEPTLTPPPAFTPTPAATDTPVSTPTPTLAPLPTETLKPVDTPTLAVTQSVEEIAQAFSGIITGAGVPEAAEYQKTEEGPHLILLLTDEGEKHDWNKNLRPEWVPNRVSNVELVAVITYFNTTIATQKYTGCGVSGPIFISRIRRDLRIVLMEAKTGNTVSGETFQGEEPPGFDWSTKCSTTAFYGEGVTYTVVQEWLRPFITP